MEVCVIFWDQFGGVVAVIGWKLCRFVEVSEAGGDLS